MLLVLVVIFIFFNVNSFIDVSSTLDNFPHSPVELPNIVLATKIFMEGISILKYFINR